MAANLSRLKSTQYLLICRAGLAVSAETEAASEELKRDMLQEFKDAVAKFSISDDLKGYPTDILMRSKNFIARVCKKAKNFAKFAKKYKVQKNTLSGRGLFSSIFFSFIERRPS